MDTFNDFITVLSSDTCRILDLFFRLVINTVFTLIIARNFYFPKARRRDFFFTYILVGFCIFMLIHLMGDAKIKTGIAMGLFAIFCIISMVSWLWSAAIFVVVNMGASSC